MKTSNALHNISRHGQVEGWQVRVTRNGVERSKYFADKNVGNAPEQSLYQAIFYRDQLLNVSMDKFIRKF